MPSSGYTAITFVANEQPTTAKWNLIGSNDASFNTGNGFNDDIILARHVADDQLNADHMDWAVATGKVWWEEIGRAKLSSPAQSMTISSLPKRKFMKMFIYIAGNTEAVVPRIRFNGDTGNNYAARRSESGAADAVSTSANGIPLHASAWLSMEMYEVYLANYTSRVKGVYFSGLLGASAASSAPTRIEGSGHWAKNSTDITSVTFITDANQFNTDTEIVIMGHDQTMQENEILAKVAKIAKGVPLELQVDRSGKVIAMSYQTTWQEGKTKRKFMKMFIYIAGNTEAY